MNKKAILERIVERHITPKRYVRTLNPIIYHLAQIDWAIFGTITFKDDYLTYDTSMSEELRQQVYFRLIGRTCSRLKIKNRKLMFYFKTEWGAEKRGHCNFIIGREGLGNISPEELAKTMQNLWVEGLYPIGTAKIEAFLKDSHWKGLNYQTKYEHDEFGNRLNHTEIFSDLLQKRMSLNAEEEIVLAE